MNNPRNNFWTEERITLYESARETGHTLHEALTQTCDLDMAEIEARLGEYRTEIEASIILSTFDLADVQREIANRTQDYDVLDANTFEQSYSTLLSGRNHPFGWNPNKGFSDTDLDDLQLLSRKWKVELNPKRLIPVWLDNRINDELTFVGSTHRIFSGMSGKHRAIVFGPCDEYQDDLGLTCMRFVGEVARTPIAAHVIPAYSIPGIYVIRKISCEFARDVKYMPWIRDEIHSRPHPVFRKPDLGSAQDIMNREIARHYVTKHGANKMAIARELLEDIELQTLLFCRGQLIHHRHLGLENVAMITAARGKVDTSCGNIAALTECCVETGGSLFEFKELAETDPEKARLHLLMFLSDLFYSDSAQLMEQSELLLTAFLPAITADEFDVAWFTRAFSWLQEYVESAFASFLGGVRSGILTARHYVPDSGEEISHDLIEQHVAEHIKSGDAEEGEQPFATSVAGWHTRINLMRQLAQDDYANLIVRVLEFKKSTNRELIESLFPTWNGDNQCLCALFENKVLPELIANLEA